MYDSPSPYTVATEVISVMYDLYCKYRRHSQQDHQCEIWFTFTIQEPQRPPVRCMTFTVNTGDTACQWGYQCDIWFTFTIHEPKSPPVWCMTFTVNTGDTACQWGHQCDIWFTFIAYRRHRKPWDVRVWCMGHFYSRYRLHRNHHYGLNIYCILNPYKGFPFRHQFYAYASPP